MSSTIIVTQPPSPTEQWADRICTQLGKSVEAIIDVGRLLIAAKADLPHGEWGRLFDERLVPFSQETARQLMTVASHPLLSNSNHGGNLPPSWRTLYELTRLPEATLQHAIADGLITPDMPRKAVQALLGDGNDVQPDVPTLEDVEREEACGRAAELALLRRTLDSPDLTVEECFDVYRRGEALYYEAYARRIRALAERDRLSAQLRAEFGDALADLILRDPEAVRLACEQRLAELAAEAAS
jgi:hypothetical protein